MRYILLFSLIAAAASGVDAQEAQQTAAPAAAKNGGPVAAGYVAHRVFNTRKNRFADFEVMVAELAKADIVFLGEQHDDPRTHQLQAAVLEGIARRQEGPVVVSFEMFERDAQAALDAYLAGTRPEDEFLADARPWPNYQAYYRPMVEFAKSRNWPMVGANVPRRLAQAVSRQGLATLDSLPANDRALIARDLSCPRDEYWKRFAAQMGDISGHGVQLTKEQADAMVQRFYESQCVKDETMAEAIAAAYTAHGAPVVHANGAFHSDYRLGTVSRVRRRLPDAKIVVVSFVPVTDLDRANGKSRRKLGEWVVFTLATPKPAAAPIP